MGRLRGVRVTSSSARSSISVVALLAKSSPSLSVTYSYGRGPRCILPTGPHCLRTWTPLPPPRDVAFHRKDSATAAVTIFQTTNGALKTLRILLECPGHSRTHNGYWTLFVLNFGNIPKGSHRTVLRSATLWTQLIRPYRGSTSASSMAIPNSGSECPRMRFTSAIALW